MIEPLTEKQVHALAEVFAAKARLFYCDIPVEAVETIIVDTEMVVRGDVQYERWFEAAAEGIPEEALEQALEQRRRLIDRLLGRRL